MRHNNNNNIELKQHSRRARCMQTSNLSSKKKFVIFTQKRIQTRKLQPKWKRNRKGKIFPTICNTYTNKSGHR